MPLTPEERARKHSEDFKKMQAVDFGSKQVLPDIERSISTALASSEVVGSVNQPDIGSTQIAVSMNGVQEIPKDTTKASSFVESDEEFVTAPPVASREPEQPQEPIAIESPQQDPLLDIDIAFEEPQDSRQPDITINANSAQQDTGFAMPADAPQNPQQPQLQVDQPAAQDPPQAPEESQSQPEATDQAILSLQESEPQEDQQPAKQSNHVEEDIDLSWVDSDVYRNLDEPFSSNPSKNSKFDSQLPKNIFSHDEPLQNSSNPASDKKHPRPNRARKTPRHSSEDDGEFTFAGQESKERQPNDDIVTSNDAADRPQPSNTRTRSHAMPLLAMSPQRASDEPFHFPQEGSRRQSLNQAGDLAETVDEASDQILRMFDRISQSIRSLTSRLSVVESILIRSS